jgi:4-alpha-glucanotransferase
MQLPNWISRRCAGVLLHPSSLPGGNGIGCLNNFAYEWIDFLHDAGFTYWQTCPLGPTGFGDSPYQVFCSSAGNPYFIDLNVLIECDYLSREKLNSFKSLCSRSIDFGKLYSLFFPLLRCAFDQFTKKPQALEDRYGPITAFEERNSKWLIPFASYQSNKFQNDLRPWWEWPDEFSYKSSNNPANNHEYKFQVFLQYLFRSQWRELKKYAQSKGVKIIGDLPIYVAPDSSEIWSNKELFQVNTDGKFSAVAGVPPDYFNESGQFWGNPLYDWDKHRADNYSWWMDRIKDQLDLFDVVRIDHFRAFHDFWSIPHTAKDARAGSWEMGPGESFWQIAKKSFPELPFLAEDLGDISNEVRSLRTTFGLPGMAVLQFAFDGNSKNLYLPHNLTRDLVLYTGTHDNDTSCGWYHSNTEDIRSQFRSYLNVDGTTPSWDMVRQAYRSVSQLIIFPAQDLLSLGSEARFNTPGVPSGNWSWRMAAEQFQALRNQSTDYLYNQASICGRLPTPKGRPHSK